jgi:hypothetical protein
MCDEGQRPYNTKWFKTRHTIVLNWYIHLEAFIFKSTGCLHTHRHTDTHALYVHDKRTIGPSNCLAKIIRPIDARRFPSRANQEWYLTRKGPSGQQEESEWPTGFFFSDLQKSWAETHKCNENFSKVGHYISPEDCDFNYFLPFTIMISNHANNQYVCTDSQ